MAAEALLMDWGQDDHFDHPLIDEQHRGLVAMINSLDYFIQQGWCVKDLRPTINMIEKYIEFHLKTEELILSKHGLPDNDLSVVSDYFETFLDELNMVVRDAIAYKQPEVLTSYLGKWWEGHKTEFHEKLQSYIKD